MSLQCSHDAYDGACTLFNHWRRAVAKAAGLPPLDLMEGFYSPVEGHWPATLNAETRKAVEHLSDALPIRWECLKPDPLHELLNHSDCDGHIEPYACGPLADRLDDITDLMPDQWKGITERFKRGCREAFNDNERLEFF